MMTPDQAMSERPSKLNIDERPVGEITVVTMRGEITVDDGDIAFGRYIDGLIMAGRVKIVVNLAGVTYIDSAGVGMMVAERKMVQEAGGVMKLSNLTARSHHLLAMMKLKLVFDIFETEEAAVASFKWGMR
jgi:anti-sigma B factor antagonist